MNLQENSRKQRKHLPATPTLTLETTLGDVKWLASNEEKIRALLPESWVSKDILSPARLGPALLEIGIPVNTVLEFHQVLLFLHRAGILLTDGHTVMRNPLPMASDSDHLL